MKKIICILLLLPVFLVAQRKPYGSIHIQSADNTRFYLELDGKRINPEPLTRIFVTKLPKLVYAVKIISATDESMTFEREKFFVCNKEKEFKSYEYKLTTDKKKLKFKFQSMKPYKYQPYNVDDRFRFDLSEKKQKGSDDSAVIPSEKKEKKRSKETLVKPTEKKDSLRTEKTDKIQKEIVKKSNALSDSASVEIIKQKTKTKIEIDSASIKASSEKPSNKKLKSDNKKTSSVKEKDSVFVGVEKKNSEQGVMPKETEEKRISPKEKVEQPKKDSSLVGAKKEKTTTVKPNEGKVKKEYEKMVATKNTKVSKVDSVKNPIPMETKIPDDSKLLKDLVLVEPADWACDHGWPMHKANFERMLDSISILPNDTDKLKKAKDLAYKNCLITDQVYEISSRLNIPEIRFEWIKFAYKYTIDVVHYTKLGTLIKDEKQKNQFYYFITH